MSHEDTMAQRTSFTPVPGASKASRKAKRILLFLAMVLSPAQAAKSGPPAWAEAVAEAIWAGLQAVPWDGFHHQWVESNPEAGNATWERFQGGGGGGQWAGQEWCEHYTLETKTHSEEVYSYAFPASEAAVCRFQQFRASATGLSVSALEEVHRALAERISERYGAPEEPERVHDFGSADWHHLLRWETEQLEVVVYIDEPLYRQPRLGLRARHRHLLNALADDHRLYRAHNRLQHIEREVEEMLVDALGALLPALPRLLGHHETQASLDEVADALLQLLQNAQNIESSQRAAFLLAADRLAFRLQHGLDYTYPKWNELRERLATYGLRYQGDKLGDTWIYLRDLQARVWTEYPETRWGEYAFVLLLSLGWYPGVACPNGSDTFRAVIEHGEEFLTHRPDSAQRSAVVFALAQAYETWWSLSQASAKDAYVNPADYRHGADEARKLAVVRYEEIARLTPESDEALYAHRRLPRLRLELDTNQRRYYCIYD